MAKELEIEFKTTITATEYNDLMSKFKGIKKTKMTNYYFDTEDFQLRSIHHNVRIREQNRKYTLTLKKPDVEGNIEINHQLTAKDAKKFISSVLEIPFEEMKKEIPVQGDLLNFAKLTTTRLDMPYKGGKLMIDKSEYFDITDYEIEFEYFDYKEGLRVFMETLSEFNIRYKKSKAKVRRVFEIIEQKNAME